MPREPDLHASRRHSLWELRDSDLLGLRATRDVPGPRYLRSRPDSDVQWLRSSDLHRRLQLGSVFLSVSSGVHTQCDPGVRNLWDANVRRVWPVGHLRPGNVHPGADASLQHLRYRDMQRGMHLGRVQLSC
jgi:hypothetical protein